MKIPSDYQWKPFPALLKRLFDILTSITILLTFFPVYLLIILIIAITDGFPVFYTQKRVGRLGKEFDILKFRTMEVDAEKGGPMLSSENDQRITKVGKSLRKWRIDELPQMINVLKGDMSMVGPRPEREYYVDQLLHEVPNYNDIFGVSPGITSKGMVKYGYASTLQEMKQRAPYDINYVHHLSLVADIKILFQTIGVILDGAGK